MTFGQMIMIIMLAVFAWFYIKNFSFRKNVNRFVGKTFRFIKKIISKLISGAKSSSSSTSYSKKSANSKERINLAYGPEANLICDSEEDRKLWRKLFNIEFSEKYSKQKEEMKDAGSLYPKNYIEQRGEYIQEANCYENDYDFEPICMRAATNKQDYIKYKMLEKDRMSSAIANRVNYTAYQILQEERKEKEIRDMDNRIRPIVEAQQRKIEAERRHDEIMDELHKAEFDLEMQRLDLQREELDEQMRRNRLR